MNTQQWRYLQQLRLEYIAGHLQSGAVKRILRKVAALTCVDSIITQRKREREVWLMDVLFR